MRFACWTTGTANTHSEPVIFIAFPRQQWSTDDNIIRRMRFACWTVGTANTHSESVILIAFPRQQWSTDDDIIRCMRFACWTIGTANTRSEYVIFIAFPRQQWLTDDDIIRRMCVACWTNRTANTHSESYVYWTVHHPVISIKIDQLDVTCSIISLFNAQHVSNVSTAILRSLRLICWVISWVVLLWFDVCWCYGVVRLGWSIIMQAEALLQPA